VYSAGRAEEFAEVTVVHELPELRDRIHVFSDRRAAGKVLADMLAEACGRIQDGAVLAIPSGGVPVGIELALRLALPLDLMIVRKIPVPWNPEAGFGAVTLSGETFLNEEILPYLHLNPGDIESQVETVLGELRRRDELFRQGRPPVAVAGRTVVVADDGLASGFTMLAAVEALRRRGAEEIVVAVPTASDRAISRLASKVHAIFCPNRRSARSFAVAEAYMHWHDLGSEEVLGLLREAGLFNPRP